MKKIFQTISPVDGSIYVERAYATDSEIETALQLASAAQRQWRTTSWNERASICRKAVEVILSDQNKLGKEISWQMGRPLQYTSGELKGFAERANYMVDIAEHKLSAIQIKGQSGYNRFIKREPVGVVFSIVPWNYPYLTAVNSIVPAIMAGNTIIMKPSTQTPLCAERLQNAFSQVGLPRGVLQHLFLDHDTTRRMVNDEAINFVAFTGSVAGGYAMQLAAHSRFIGMGLELGGKDPAYVRADADLTFSVSNLVDGVYFNCGQSCCGIERIYVHEQVYSKFIEEFVDLVNQYKLGNPLDEKTTLGPMAKIRNVELVRRQIEQAVAGGARALIDTKVFDAELLGEHYLAPQVLVEVDHGMSVMRDESFGPVVGIMKVTSDAEAVSLMNDSAFGLTASVWTADENIALELGDQVCSGTWFMNRCDYLDPALAWTGIKNSGHGCSLSEIGYEQLTQAKSFHLRQAQ